MQLAAARQRTLFGRADRRARLDARCWMRTQTIIAGIDLALGACGRGEPVHPPPVPQTTSLALVVPTATLQMQPGETRLVQLLVIGDAADRATLSSPDLPSFAKLEGALLSLA